MNFQCQRHRSRRTEHIPKSWTDHPFGYWPDAWYSSSGSRMYLPISGFVYMKMGQAGKITSTVLTFYPSPVRGMLHATHMHMHLHRYSRVLRGSRVRDGCVKWLRMTPTLHEHKHVRRVEIARAVLGDRELNRSERLADRERDPVGIVCRDVRRVRLDLRIKRRSTRNGIRIIGQERPQLLAVSATNLSPYAKARRAYQISHR